MYREPTNLNYMKMREAYDYFNKHLFSGQLPPCLITFQRKNQTRGYFSHERFEHGDDGACTDEIALNPSHFRERGTKEVLSTLVHEMVHLWQYHFGKPGRGGYHNREWADKMEELGLIPSDSGAPGGKRTGTRVTHYIAEGGPFDLACNDLISGGYRLPYIERAREPNNRKRASKTRFTCELCGQNAWAKPSAKIICGECQQQMDAVA